VFNRQEETEEESRTAMEQNCDVAELGLEAKGVKNPKKRGGCYR
jgi:hypothetical protein